MIQQITCKQPSLCYGVKNSIRAQIGYCYENYFQNYYPHFIHRFFGFAIKNDQIVTLQYFFGYQQSAPLVILLLVFFLSGGVLGILAMVPMVYRHKRDISKHKNNRRNRK